jgi:ABC-2 type transport system permease protein
VSPHRLRAGAVTGWRSFVRRRTAVFFTFLFPALIVLIFGVLVETGGGGAGLFARPQGYYLPGYLAVVVLFTPLSRVGSEVARHRDGNRFERLAATPLSAGEWLAAVTAVNVAVVGLAAALLLVLVVTLTGAAVTLSPLLAPLVVLATVLFCGVGAVLGALADSQDGVIAAANTLALPLLFLSETFVSTAMLPGWFAPATALSPLTYFARGVRAATYGGGDPLGPLAALTVLAVVALAAGAYALPWRE